MTNECYATRVHATVAIACHPRVPRAHVDSKFPTAEFVDDHKDGHVGVHHQDSHLVLDYKLGDLVQEVVSGSGLSAVSSGNDVVEVDDEDHWILRKEGYCLMETHSDH